MGIEFELKNLIPFGSAILGGYITYRLSKTKEKQEADKKRLESLFELQRLNLKLMDSLGELQYILNKYTSDPLEKEDYNEKVVTSMIIECSNELVDSYVLSLGHAVHISKEVFECVKKTHEDARFFFGDAIILNENIVNGTVRKYSEKNVVSLKKALDKIKILQDILMDKEEKYVEQYIK